MGDGTNGDFIRISNREIWEAVTSLKDRVAGVERRLDSILGENVEFRKRLRALELKTYTIMAGLVSAVIIVFRVGGPL